jgi:hypothetical protein
LEDKVTFEKVLLKEDSGGSEERSRAALTLSPNCKKINFLIFFENALAYFNFLNSGNKNRKECF